MLEKSERRAYTRNMVARGFDGWVVEPPAEDLEASEAEPSKALRRWRTQARGLLRLSFVRRLWGLLGARLREIKQQGSAKS